MLYKLKIWKQKYKNGKAYQAAAKLIICREMQDWGTRNGDFTRSRMSNYFSKKRIRKVERKIYDPLLQQGIYKPQKRRSLQNLGKE